MDSHSTPVIQDDCWRLAAENAAAGVWDWDLLSGTVFFSPLWKMLLGLDPDEIRASLGEWSSRVHPDDSERCQQALDRHLAGKSETLNVEHRLRHKEGHYLWFLNRARVVSRDTSGAPLRMVGSIIDISTQKDGEQARIRAEQRLREELRELAVTRTLLESTNEVAKVGAWKVDLQTGKITWSPVTRAIHEVDLDFVPVLDIAINFYKEGWHRDTLVQQFNDCITHQGSFDLELILVTAKGNERWVRVAGKIEHEDGTPTLALGALQDIHERKTAEQALIRAKNDAEAANRAKSAFLASMSHEMRTPLNGIIGSTELLETMELTRDQRHLVEMVLTSGELLLSTVSDILDYSKIEADQMELESSPLCLVEMVEQVLDIFSVQAQKKSLPLGLFLKPGTDPRIIGDSVRIRQVLTNLVGNALKFTDRGSVAVHLHQEPDRSIKISVEDTGIGIPEDKFTHLFDAFTQVDISTTRRYGGTGLGLAITKRLVEKMGGTILVESKVGRGSTFTVALPTASIPNQLSPGTGDIELPHSLAGIQILILGFNSFHCRWAETAVRALGAPTAQVINLESQTDTEAAIPPSRADIILIAQPPGSYDEKSANDFCAGYSDGTPILQLGGNREVSLHGRPPKEWLPSPVRLHRLAKACRHAYEDIQHLSDPSKPAPDPKGELAGRILVVEDDRVNQMVIKRILVTLGLADVCVAENGEQALQLFQNQTFDLILMDCQMPVMDGFEATKKILDIQRSEPRPSQIPIIGLSAGALNTDRDRGLEIGMAEYLTKPIRIDTLRNVLRRYLAPSL